VRGRGPGECAQLAAVKANVTQGAVVQFDDAGELGAIAKISPDGIEKKCGKDDPVSPNMMLM